MKTLYLECRMGAAGDMLAAALSELTDKQEFLRRISEAGIGGITVSLEEAEKCGIKGTHMTVIADGEEEESHDVHDHDHHHHHDHDEHEHHHHHDHDDHEHHHHHDHDDHEHHHHHDHDDHEHHHHHDHDHEGHTHHHHAHLSDIHALIGSLNVSDKVKEDAKNVYGLLAQAESHAHGQPVENIHFHEVGTKDAVADIVSVCILMEMVGADRVIASPVATGSGMVRCAHGILPVPAPATAYLLQGIPSYAGRMEGELLTPTGAALLKYFASSFGTMPVMATEKIGYGMGKKDFPAANCVRAFLGESEDAGEVTELVCNLDDLTPEETGRAMDVLFANGALDVYFTPVIMKKNRPGIVFTCVCRADDVEKMLGLIFRHTTTLGIREYTSRRHALKREIRTEETEFGAVRAKYSSGYGVDRVKYEYDDLSRIAEETGLSVREIADRIKSH
ncbi:MAG: nickel pincer cofactor biosynthesis protein LarC [Solobacterium sp.]|nr:nickel pincer cofactor biosynthesis protein LarC [Solobacterium sp.]